MTSYRSPYPCILFCSIVMLMQKLEKHLKTELLCNSLTSYVKIHFLKKLTKFPKQNGNLKFCLQRTSE